VRKKSLSLVGKVNVALKIVNFTGGGSNVSKKVSFK